MSKGNLFLGYARGKVGDVVFSRQNGEQITRARNRAPKNPQTAYQLTQRVCLKTASLAFSLMQDICNHSFQSVDGKTPNQSRFNRVNIALMRQQLAEYINSGDPNELWSCPETNFAQRSTVLPPIRPYVVSEGTLQSQLVSMDGGYISLETLSSIIPGESGPTYAEICQAFGLNRGDQLTFILLTTDDTESGVNGVFNGFYYARVIMEPSDGDMSSAFLTGSGTIQQVNKPNPRNEGNPGFIVNMSSSAFAGLDCTISGVGSGTGIQRAVAAGTVIASRLNGAVWERSSQSLVVRDSLQWDWEVFHLYDALESYVSNNGSSLYLNQAGNF